MAGKFNPKSLKRSYDIVIDEDDFSVKMNRLQKKFRHLSGCTCSDCDKSPGEERIRIWLEEHSIFFKAEYRIKECRNVLPLPFDFAIFCEKENKTLKMLIEFDGQQHFHEMGGIYKDKFPEIKRHDEIKNEYCARKGIPLIRISYKNLDRIDEILTKEVV